MLKPFLLVITFVLMFAQVSIAHTLNGDAGIVPDNDLYISADAKNIKQISLEEFNKVLDRLEAIYAPIFEEKGGKFTLERAWDDGTVNAYAKQEEKIWIVHMYGGLARHEVVTSDGFALVGCHEIGHHIGGAPKKKGLFWGRTWASIEGQADYFATLKCMREYFESDNNQEIVAKMDVPAFATEKCIQVHGKDKEQVAICQRSAMAGMSLAALFNELRNSQTELSFETPNPQIVSVTDEKHPEAQCRLDTYFQGALCDEEKNIDTHVRDAKVGTCNRSTGHEIGIRPLCWFNPKKY